VLLLDQMRTQSVDRAMANTTCGMVWI